MAKSAPVATRKILFWQAVVHVKAFCDPPKEDFSLSYQDTFLDSRSKYIRFHTMLCICFMFVRMSGIQWYKFRDEPTHISLLEAGKRILVDFTKMKRETTSEYSVILTAFYPFFVKVLTSRPARIVSKRVVTMFWVLGSLPQIRAIQRTLNHDRTTSQSFFIRHCFNPPH